jgi:hypothetical protein
MLDISKLRLTQPPVELGVGLSLAICIYLRCENVLHVLYLTESLEVFKISFQYLIFCFMLFHFANLKNCTDDLF